MIYYRIVCVYHDGKGSKGKRATVPGWVASAIGPDGTVQFQSEKSFIRQGAINEAQKWASLLGAGSILVDEEGE